MEENKKNVAASEDTAPAPRKVLLGKKVVRHFAVRTGVQTGNTSTGTGCSGTRMSLDGGGGGVATNARC